jgi:hypothetical protein
VYTHTRARAQLCVEDVWRRGLLTKGVGVCHGVSGSVLALLSHYRLASRRSSLRRASAMVHAMIAHRRFEEATLREGDEPMSLFNGVGGRVWALLELRAALTDTAAPCTCDDDDV